MKYQLILYFCVTLGACAQKDEKSKENPVSDQSDSSSKSSHSENMDHEQNQNAKMAQNPNAGADQDNEELKSLGFVYLGPGNFTQGDHNGLSLTNAIPSHDVAISKAFYIHESEVTLGEYQQFDPIAKGDVDCASDSDCPVAFVSWNDANSYIAWLNEKKSLEDDYKYRLCSESEWEYAARAGSDTKWHSGNDPESLEDFAWFNNPGQIGYKIKQKQPNAWGLFDMHGNMRELVADTWNLYDNDEKLDPLVTGEGPKVWKSGNWCLSAEQVRSAMRGQIGADTKSHVVGFRLCASR
ncbi:MAG: formylglycine-generating enzyme family protein [Oligoflexales bacterium]